MKRGTMRTTIARVLGTLRALVRHSVEAHRFFRAESPQFVGRWQHGKYAWNRKGSPDGRFVLPWRERLRWPLAWTRFMGYSLRDWMRMPNNRVERLPTREGGSQ